MRRTQIYLEDEQHAALLARARKCKRTMSEEIRAAIDVHLTSPPPERDRRNALRQLFGLCKDDPDFETRVLEARKSADRDVFAERK